MTRQNLSRGTSANDGTGDTLRDAALKINQNFVELYQFLGADSDQLYTTETLTSNGAISTTVPLTLLNSGSALSMTLADGSNNGQSKKIININSGNATVTPTSFGQGTSFTIKANGAVEIIWAASNWYVQNDNTTYLTIT
jgi:hypothetical protein